MNKTDFSIINGFPLNQMSLDRLQTAFSLFNAFGSIVGDKTIISGCTLNGTTVADGAVFVSGELFEFRGGLVQSKVSIKEDITNLIYKNGNSYPAVKTRYITFGSGVGAMDWVDFKQGFQTKGIAALVDRIVALEGRPQVGNIPIGLIALWDRPANEIPSGWQEHLVMTGKVPVGFNANDTDFDVVGKTGGSKTKTLTVANLPEHDFDIAYNTKNAAGGGSERVLDNTGTSTLKMKSGKVGQGQAVNVLNPYRVVHFIKYIG